MKNWRTTAAGLVTALAAFVVFSPELFAAWPWVIAVAKFAGIGGLGALGIAGHDAKGAPPNAGS